jgi:hypothetical protein
MHAHENQNSRKFDDWRIFGGIASKANLNCYSSNSSEHYGEDSIKGLRVKECARNGVEFEGEARE